MRIWTIAPLLALALSSSFAVAECTEVIRLSKLRTNTVQDSSSFNQMVHNFCSEYASAKSSGKTMSVGASYAGFGGSFGEGSSSAEQIASKYCDATNNSSARADAYKQYVESVAPGAFSAYERCEALAAGGVTIALPPQDGVLPLYLPITVSFTSKDSNPSQLIDFTASPGVTCRWKNGKRGTQTELTPNTTDGLECSRSSANEKSLVTIFPRGRADSSVSIPWDVFQNGVAVDLLKALTLQGEASAKSLNDATTSLRAGVLAFAATSCPSGWEEYQPAYGRFVRGIDNQPNVPPANKRAPGSLQEDAFRAHQHSRPSDVYDAGSPGVGSVNGGTAYGYAYSGARGGQGPDTGVTGAEETRPTNVALLYCKRK